VVVIAILAVEGIAILAVEEIAILAVAAATVESRTCGRGCATPVPANAN